MGERVGLIVVGYAKVPRISGAHGSGELLAICLKVDRDTGVVVEVDSTAVAGMVRDWVRELLLGVDLRGDLAPVLAEIDASFLSNASGSLKQAITDAWRRYGAHRAS